MKQKMTLLLTIVMVVLCACGHHDETVGDVLVQTKGAKQVKAKKFSDILEITNIIPLETNDKSYLQNVFKVVVNNGNYYVYDFFKSVSAFDKKGKFLFKIEAQGGGPGEYAMLKGFDVDGNSIYLMDVDKILVYNMQGQYERTINVDLKPQGLKVINGQILIKVTKPGSSMYYLLDADGKPLQDIVEYSQVNDVSDNTFFQPYKNNTYICQQFATNDIVTFDANTSTFGQTKALDMDILTVEQTRSWDKNPNSGFIDYMKEIKSNRWRVLFICSTGNQMLLGTNKDFDNKKEYEWFYADLNKDKVWSFNPYDLDNDLTFIDPRMIVFRGLPGTDRFYVCSSPQMIADGMAEHPSLLDEKRNGKLKKLIDELNPDEEANPFIIEFRFKLK